MGEGVLHHEGGRGGVLGPGKKIRTQREQPTTAKMGVNGRDEPARLGGK